MRMLVVFNTTYGNTKIIADTIVAGLGDGAMAIPVSSVGSSNLGGVDLLVPLTPRGSPIIGWKQPPLTRR